MVKTALFFLSDTTGLLPFARALAEDHGYKLLGCGSVVDVLSRAGLVVERAESWSDAMAGEGVDLIVAPLGSFERISQDVFAAFEEVIEQVNLDGPALIRCAAKRGKTATVICDTSDYERVLDALGSEKALCALRRELATKAFQCTAQYDLAVAVFLEHRSEEPDLSVLSGFSKQYRLDLKQAALLPHGENPHQQAALYGGFFDCLKQLQGETLDYNHVLDVSAAVFLIGEFEKAAVAIIKHHNPCGVASADSLDIAWEKAFATDKLSAEGGVVIVNRTLDGELARHMAEVPLEVIVAPHFTEEAMDCLSERKGLRLLMVQDMLGAESLKEHRSVVGGVLLQDRDKARPSLAQWRIVSSRQPSAEAWEALTFGWRVAKHVKSGGAVIARGEETVAIVSGCNSGERSIELACLAAIHDGKSLEGAVLVADDAAKTPSAIAFTAKMGISALIQPGSGDLDSLILDAANEAGLALVFTGTRHFKH